MSKFNLSDIKVYKHDINEENIKIIYETRIVAWDNETMGLNWESDTLCTCQLYTPNKNNEIIIVQIDDKKPEKLCSILSDNRINKVFHHAMFDLRFICHKWDIEPKNISCTKIASKILNHNILEKHRLIYLLDRFLGVKLKKELEIVKSEWCGEELSDNQKIYAANDIYYLIPLLKNLEQGLLTKNLLNLVHACFKHIPIQVQLELNGYQDVYKY